MGLPVGGGAPSMPLLLIVRVTKRERNLRCFPRSSSGRLGRGGQFHFGGRGGDCGARVRRLSWCSSQSPGTGWVTVGIGRNGYDDRVSSLYVSHRLVMTRSALTSYIENAQSR